MAAARYYESPEWERETVECVVCPGCAFTYGAEHVTEATGRHECPECGAVEVPPHDPRAWETANARYLERLP